MWRMRTAYDAVNCPGPWLTLVANELKETDQIRRPRRPRACVRILRMDPVNYSILIPVSYDSFGIEAYLLRPVFSVQILAAYLLILGSLVFLSGIFPALRASRSNPIESLRYE
jgi:ABC-type antimicrobial peptide transport system permease subunit